jgi:hypothetical protein
VHFGDGADQAARILRARAFTVGGDIVFRRGEYAPGAERGRALLAHELAHTLQDRSDVAARQVEEEAAADPALDVVNCSEETSNVSDPEGLIRGALHLARVMVQDALDLIDTPQGEPLLLREFCHAGTPACLTRGIKARIRGVYRRILIWLSGAPRFICIPHDRPACQRFSAAVRCGGGRVMLCGGFFRGSGPCNARDDDEGRAAILIHEAAHTRGIACSGESEGATERYCQQRTSGDYPPRFAWRDCADSYSEFAASAFVEQGARRVRESQSGADIDFSRIQSED